MKIYFVMKLTLRYDDNDRLTQLVQNSRWNHKVCPQTATLTAIKILLVLEVIDQVIKSILIEKGAIRSRIFFFKSYNRTNSKSIEHIFDFFSFQILCSSMW